MFNKIYKKIKIFGSFFFLCSSPLFSGKEWGRYIRKAMPDYRVDLEIMAQKDQYCLFDDHEKFFDVLLEDENNNDDYLKKIVFPHGERVFYADHDKIWHHIASGKLYSLCTDRKFWKTIHNKKIMYTPFVLQHIYFKILGEIWKNNDLLQFLKDFTLDNNSQHMNLKIEILKKIFIKILSPKEYHFFISRIFDFNKHVYNFYEKKKILSYRDNSAFSNIIPKEYIGIENLINGFPIFSFLGETVWYYDQESSVDQDFFHITDIFHITDNISSHDNDYLHRINKLYMKNAKIGRIEKYEETENFKEFKDSFFKKFVENIVPGSNNLSIFNQYVTSQYLVLDLPLTFFSILYNFEANTVWHLRDRKHNIFNSFDKNDHKKLLFNFFYSEMIVGPKNSLRISLKKNASILEYRDVLKTKFINTFPSEEAKHFLEILPKISDEKKEAITKKLIDDDAQKLQTLIILKKNCIKNGLYDEKILGPSSVHIWKYIIPSFEDIYNIVSKYTKTYNDGKDHSLILDDIIKCLNDEKIYSFCRDNEIYYQAMEDLYHSMFLNVIEFIKIEQHQQ